MSNLLAHICCAANNVFRLWWLHYCNNCYCSSNHVVLKRLICIFSFGGVWYEHKRQLSSRSLSRSPPPRLHLLYALIPLSITPPLLSPPRPHSRLSLSCSVCLAAAAFVFLFFVFSLSVRFSLQYCHYRYLFGPCATCIHRTVMKRQGMMGTEL